MPDWPIVAARWGIFAVIGALFGLQLFGLYALDESGREHCIPWRRSALMLAPTGLALSVIGLFLSAAAMLGVGPREVDCATLIMLLEDTSVGWAWIVRMIGLVGILVLALPRRRWTASYLAGPVLLGAIAVASLAWSGHGAAGEGILGTAQLVGDIVHLLTAAAWVGALAAFVLMLPRSAGLVGLTAAHRALAGFAKAGTVIVGLLILTGGLNTYILVGPEKLTSLGSSDYGRLLAIKLALFLLMLVLAASNRFRLTPSLQMAADGTAAKSAVMHLRVSLWLEFSASLAILAAVAWLGTLSPPASM